MSNMAMSMICPCLGFAHVYDLSLYRFVQKIYYICTSISISLKAGASGNV